MLLKAMYIKRLQLTFYERRQGGLHGHTIRNRNLAATRLESFLYAPVRGISRACKLQGLSEHP